MATGTLFACADSGVIQSKRARKLATGTLLHSQNNKRGNISLSMATGYTSFFFSQGRRKHSSFFLLPKTWQPARCLHAQAASGPQNLANDTLLHAQTTSRAWRQTIPSARQPARLFFSKKSFFIKTWQPAHYLHAQTAIRALLPLST